MTITYYEHYPHYMGTKNSTMTFTEREFDHLIDLSKKAIKDKDGYEDALYDHIDELQEKKNVQVYALIEALTNWGDSPRRPSTIVNALKKKNVWADDWEEGSHAFSNKGVKIAKKAVAKIEAKHAEDEFGW